MQTDLEQSIIEEIASCAGPAAVATIVRAAGSTPRKEGAKMLVFPDGTIRGTIGGGLCESEVIRRAAAMAGTGKLALKTGSHPGSLKDMVTSPGGTTIQGVRVLEERAARDGMACGGTLDILIEDLDAEC